MLTQSADLEVLENQEGQDVLVYHGQEAQEGQQVLQSTQLIGL